MPMQNRAIFSAFTHYTDYSDENSIILVFTCSNKGKLSKLRYLSKMSHHIRKSTICICENKGADQLRSNCEADQHLCFRYRDSAIPFLLKSQTNFMLLACFCNLYRLVCVRPGLKPKLLFYSHKGSNNSAEASGIILDAKELILKGIPTKRLSFVPRKSG